MKQLLITLCLMISPIVYGQSNAKATIETIKVIRELEAAENFSGAYEQTLQLVKTIYAQIHAGEIVASITSQLNKIYDEKIVTTHNSYSRSVTPGPGWFEVIIGPLVHSKIDITKIILRNPEESSEFPEKVNRDLEKLKVQVVEYVNQNAESLANLKMLSIKAVQYLVLSMGQGTVYSSSDLEIIEQKALDLAFFGEHNISACVATNFTDSSTSHEIIETNIFGFIMSTFMPFLRPKIGESTQNFAHTVKQCDSTTNKIEFNVRDQKKNLLLNFTQLDRQLIGWLKFGYAKVNFSQKEDIQFPTFGNPYYH